MISIPCQNCNHMIDIDTQVEPIKVPCYLMLCHNCQVKEKNNERDKKLKKILKKSTIEIIKNWLNK